MAPIPILASLTRRRDPSPSEIAEVSVMIREQFAAGGTKVQGVETAKSDNIAWWALLSESQLMRSLPMDELMAGMPFIDVLDWGQVGVEIGGQRILVRDDLWQFFIDAVSAHCQAVGKPLYSENVLTAAFDNWIEDDREYLRDLGFTFRVRNSLVPEGVQVH